ncbi:MAG TPA: outer membrane beta-barrel protein [Terracidiphilus sp.]|jgi:opacity protein-like surface antigen|nr:outer membrane beta-barrel protein [Terracidiphilus sp.]
MRLQSWTGKAFLAAGLAALGCGPAASQTTAALSVFGAFSGTTSGNGTAQSPSNAAGGIVELRHIANPLVGYEGTYSFNRANQTYNTTPFACPVAEPVCPPPPQSPAPVSANAHEITGDWIVSLHIANVRPFALGGLGVLINQPVSGQAETTSSNKFVYVYGAGVDWGLLPHIGLRFQYRGNLYKAPDLTALYTSTNKFTQTAEPVVGAYFRF